MKDLENLEATGLNIGEVTADGGTLHVEVTIDGNCGYYFYIDGRVGSSTSGEVYLDLPHGSEAMILNPESVLSKSIKKMISEQEEKLK